MLEYPHPRKTPQHLNTRMAVHWRAARSCLRTCSCDFNANFCPKFISASTVLDMTFVFRNGVRRSQLPKVIGAILCQCADGGRLTPECIHECARSLK